MTAIPHDVQEECDVRRAPTGPDLGLLFEPYVWAWFKARYGEPSPAQAASWPKIAEGKNTLIFSPTGSGKTLAAFLWCISDLFNVASQQALDDAVYVLYVSPLKALNNDIQKNLVEPLAEIGVCARRAGVRVPDIRSAVRTGDTTSSERASMARRPPHILITTPESLFIILSTPKFRLAFRQVRYVIVDEIHAISNNKRGVHLSLSLERLQHLVGRDFVRIGLSATQRPLEEIARYLVGMESPNTPRGCEIVDTGARKDLDVQVLSPVDNLLEAHFDAIWGSSYDEILTLIKEHDTTLVFANSRYKTERTALRLNELSAGDPVAVGAHHGSMSREVRLDMENKLKRGQLDALIATASLELGIDVGSIDLVCQIQSPKSVSTGMQRIGRAGHLLDATSKGRLLVTDRDDLVESVVLVKAIVDGEIDCTRIPTNCLDVLAQHIVGAVAADNWHVDDLYDLCRRSYCYRDVDRADYVRVLNMLSGDYELDMERAPYPKISWDRVNNVLYPERAARLIAFRSSGTIPEIEDYQVYFEKAKTQVGRLDEGFVERLHTGDVFVLGSSSWRVVGFQRNRVLVEDVYGRAPTVPFWGGDRDSRTYDLGVLVGRFRRHMQARIADGDPIGWLQDTYCVDEKGARAVCEYFREQQLVAGELPSDRLVLIERFRDELGLQQVVIHSPFGIRVNDPWAMALRQAIEEVYGFRPQTATVDDGILITVPTDAETNLASALDGALLDLVTPGSLYGLLERALRGSPIFASRFRHNAVRSLMVLREYRGRRNPVWLQSLRSLALLDACQDDREYPVIVETLRECLHESMDVPNLDRVLRAIESGEIETKVLQSRVPSPFTHSLLLLGQYGDMGAIPTRERRSRLMHLHREILRQILDKETLRNLLDEKAVESLNAQLQRTDPQRKARDANELARLLLDLGDLVDHDDEEISLLDRVDGDAKGMLADLVSAHRAVSVPIPTAETNRQRWISTENYPLYRAAFGLDIGRDEVDEQILCHLTAHGPLPSSRIAELVGLQRGHARERIGKLVSGYSLLRLPGAEGTLYAAAQTWIPSHIRAGSMSRAEARLQLVLKYLKGHGPITKYEVMERYGFPDGQVERLLATLLERGRVVRGEYVPTKSLPQWCDRGNLEQIHRATLNRLRREMEPATPVEYADFLVRWQHVHPDTQLSGLDGLRQVIGQIQAQENYQIVYERDVLPTRVTDYDPSMLDRLCYGGEVFWRRFDFRRLRRGFIGFCFRSDRDWVVTDPQATEMTLDQWDDDIPEACLAVRSDLRSNGACFFDDIIRRTQLDWRLVLRAIWHLVWTGEVTNDSYESIRHADIASGLSACYDLGTKPGRKGVTNDFIVRHMLELCHLDPRLGRWAPTERLLPTPLDPEAQNGAVLQWARLLLRRHGIVSRESVKRESAAPQWKDLRRALIRLELLGEVRRGFFVQELSGEQYAWPDAVETLREAKLRHPDLDGEDGEDGSADPASEKTDEPMILLNACDPANVFGALFAATNQAGEPVQFVRVPQKYLVIQGGQPILLYEGRVTLFRDLSGPRVEQAVKTLIAAVDHPSKVAPHREIHVQDWNGHPIDVSPARHLLTVLGFVQASSRWKGFVYDGVHRPSLEAIAQAAHDVPKWFEHVGKETAPVRYDGEWIISRASTQIRDKVRQLLSFLERVLPSECRITYGPRQFTVRYRGFRCMSPYVQQKQIYLQITHKGWTRGIQIGPNTDLDAAQFASAVLERLQKVTRQIDLLLDADQRRA